jgi:protoporphyrinogen oxidase
MANIVIIGAGLTGLSAAYHLEQRGFFDYILFEKEADVGGLCRSVQQDGFTFDYTGHLLHASDPYFRQFLETIVGLQNLNSIARQSFIFSHNVYTRYPFQVNLFGLPPAVIAECIEGFVRKKQSRKSAKTFHNWVLHNFGDGIANHFFFPFQQKIFAYDIKKVSATWMGRFVPATSLKQMIEGALTDNDKTALGYNAQFFYPKQRGIQFWIEKLKNQIKNPIQLDHALQSVNLRTKTLTFAKGRQEQFKLLINTAPLDLFLGMLQERAHTTLARARKKLVCNSVVNFNLGIAGMVEAHKHWIYFPESAYPFYRIGFPHNFAASMAPAGYSSLYGEYSFIHKSVSETEAITETAIKKVQRLLNIADEQIVTKKIMTIDRAYVIYTLWREKYLSHLLEQLNQENIYSIGRYGGWKYSSMQEAVLDGKAIAEQLTVYPASKLIYPTFIATENQIQKEQG